MSAEDARGKALHFIREEKQFHLGFLPTEQAHPKTKNLDRLFAESVEKGVRNLQEVDRDVWAAAKKILAGAEFAKMVADGVSCLEAGGKIVFSGCGATGRLSILLESMWKKFFQRGGTDGRLAGLEGQVESIMTGGDYALIRSVENFEDYKEFGRRQAREANISGRDMLVAITEGGETSSVLGTVDEALDRGAKVFLLFNNPKDLLRRVERSRQALDDKRVTVLELFSGQMAVAGSTRMQAVTFELLAAGAALEKILIGIAARRGVELGGAHAADHASEFRKLLDGLAGDSAVAELASHIEFEAKIYASGGLVTYFANDYLLDILTDTTERAPTFSLPPFRKSDDSKSPPSWAFVKNPTMNTAAAWRHTLARDARCLAWTPEIYRSMGAAEKICEHPPKLDANELFKFAIGNEADASRLSKNGSAAVMVAACSETTSESFGDFGKAFENSAEHFQETRRLTVGKCGAAGRGIPVEIPDTPLRLMEHLAAKLVLNTISTGTMVRLGRVSGNWMSFVEMTNKKLVDRSVRLISELCGLSYDDACFSLFESAEEIARTGLKVSPVQHAMAKIRKESQD